MMMYARCFGCALLFLLLSLLTGKLFLSSIKTNDGFCENILFGFLLLIVSYQVFYLPVLLMRGSYRTMSFIWLATIGSATFVSAIRILLKRKTMLPFLTMKQWLSVITVSVAILFLCAFISMHAPIYGPDFQAYNTAMNNLYYKDNIWISSGSLDLRHSLNSFYGLMTIPSLVFGIPPYYAGLFMTRSLLIIMSSLVAYRTGAIVFKEDEQPISGWALGTVLLTSTLLLLWHSDYQPYFYYYRANEAKSFCQFLLLPLGFSVFIQMFRTDVSRTSLWILQLLVGLSAVPVSMSSLTAYPFLVFVGTAALLAYDRFRGGAKTCLWSLLCISPNILYTIFYILIKKGLFTF